MKNKQIIAIGDGGLDEDYPLISYYIAAQIEGRIPKICVIPTASGDNSGLIYSFMKIFRFCDTSFLTLFHPKVRDIKKFLLSQDIIFVPGGNSKALLGIWKEWGLPEILKEAYENGTILAGGSAGAVCWFQECITDSYYGSLEPMKCLDLLPMSVCPHYTSSERRKAYKEAVSSKSISSGYGIGDYAALHFVNGEVLRGLSFAPFKQSFQPSIYHLSLDNGGGLLNNKLSIDNLNDVETQDKLIWNTPLFTLLNNTKANQETPTSLDV